MAETDSLTIGALPKDGHPWRIDWFGDLAFPNRFVRRQLSFPRFFVFQQVAFMPPVFPDVAQ
jgi:hypothetical protein